LEVVGSNPTLGSTLQEVVGSSPTLGSILEEIVGSNPAASSRKDRTVSQWCVVGNIVAEGTKHFVPGAKVYCIAPLWGDGGERLNVVGYHRGSHGRDLVRVIMPSAKIEKLRAKEVFDPRVLAKLDGRLSKKSANEMVRSIGR